ncbi:MAG: DNA primase [Candidatus Sumerlaeaceae bacterium]|nr:DNA primase [Candidatus Sumerlaeaceae bacterium]
MGTLVDFANQLRDRVDIVDVVSGYVKLKRAGSNWKGLCPFHREKTPSFMVSQAKQIFHCFGCHKGGDVIRFIELAEHVEWKEALRLLAERYGVPLPEFSKASRDSSTDIRKILYDINEISCQFFSRHLTEALGDKSHPIAEYVSKRQLDAPTLTKFRIGLAPAEWTKLVDELRKLNYDAQQCLAAGIALRHAESGRIYDRFRARLMFPIFDNLGRPIAFGGRVYLPDSSLDQPKYVNSPETELYKKGQYLYAFHLAKEAIVREGFAILVEGYFDVIRAHQHGFANTVASCGTALTTEQARALRRICDTVVFVYDGDEAGQQAMLRGCEVLLEHEFTIKIVVLPDNQDPDSFLLAYGKGAFRQHVEHAQDFYHFFLDRAIQQYGCSSVQEKVQAFNFLRPVLAKIHNAIALDAYLLRTAQVLGTDVSSLRRELARTARQSEPILPSVAVAPLDQGTLLERYVLKVCVEREELRVDLVRLIAAEWLTHPLIRKWFVICCGRLFDCLEVNWSELLALCDDPDCEDAQFLRGLMLEESEPLATIDVVALKHVAARLERAYLMREARQLSETCKTLYPQDPDGLSWESFVRELNAKLPKFREVTRACRPPQEIWRNAESS